MLIDEAQDFEPVWFRCVLAALQDPVDGDLLIVGDGNQGLYRQHKVSWKELGIQAQGRTVSARFELDRNYPQQPGNHRGGATVRHCVLPGWRGAGR